MKKVKYGILLIISVLFLTACSCEKEKYIVTFDTDGGSVVPSQKIEKGDNAYEPKDPVKDELKFGGWFLDLNDENPYNFSTEVIKDITLKAKWIDPNVKVYNITFDSDGGSSVSSIILEEGKEVNLPTPKKTGYKFLGWYNGKTKIESTKNIKANTKLVAKWEEEKEEEPKEVVKATSISLNKTSITLAVGKSEKVSASIKPNNTTNKKVTYKSSDVKVAKVSSNGEITAVGKGNATITATLDGKSATVKVTVVANDKSDMENAKAKVSAKTLTGPTSLKFSSPNCTIVGATQSSGKTIVSEENVTKLYRSKSGGTLTSTYTITCGNEKDTVTINHKISPSPYSYTAINSPGSMYYIITVNNGATNYTLSSSKASNLKYNSNWSGVQTDIVTHEDGIVYDMVLSSEPNTIYQVTGTTN